jgi:hypothetical protein
MPLRALKEQGGAGRLLVLMNRGLSRPEKGVNEISGMGQSAAVACPEDWLLWFLSQVTVRWEAGRLWHLHMTGWASQARGVISGTRLPKSSRKPRVASPTGGFAKERTSLLYRKGTEADPLRYKTDRTRGTRLMVLPITNVAGTATRVTRKNINNGPRSV